MSNNPKKVYKRKLIYGTGETDVNYTLQILETVHLNGVSKQVLVWECPYYRVWKDMLKRCYSAKYHEKRPTYKDCHVCLDWLKLSNFKAWMEQQDWQGKQLDKDILIFGNRVYSPETCVFVTSKINCIFRDNRRNTKLPNGVYFRADITKYQASCGGIWIGVFSCPVEAGVAAAYAKLKMVESLTAELEDTRIKDALIKRANYFIEIARNFKIDSEE